MLVELEDQNPAGVELAALILFLQPLPQQVVVTVVAVVLLVHQAVQVVDLETQSELLLLEPQTKVMQVRLVEVHRSLVVAEVAVLQGPVLLVVLVVLLIHRVVTE